MSPLWRGLVPIAALVALACGTSAPRFLFFLDPYSAQLQPGLAREVEPAFRAAMVVRPIGQEAERDLRGILAGRRPSVVFLSPLFDLDLEALAGEYPEVLFVRPETAPGGAGPPRASWLPLRFDYAAAMREAGRHAARLASDPALGIRLGASSAAPVRVGILVSESAPWLQQRVTAFRQGLAEAGETRQALYRQVDSVNDRVKARRLLEEMRAEGAGVFLLLTYSLSGFCLDYLGKEGALAIAQDAAAAAAYPETVAAYFEEDTADALRRLRQLAQEGPAPEVLSVAARLRPTPEWAAPPSSPAGGGRP